MKHTIGSFLYTCLLITSVSAQSPISISFFSMENEPLQQAGVGKPFLLEISLKKASTTVEQPSIAGLEQAQVKSAGFQMRTINGVTDVMYRYHVRFDQVGEYGIGPVTIGSQTSEMSSIVVGTDQKVRQTRAKKVTTDGTTFLRLTLDKQRAVVGQHMYATLRFYASKPVELSTITEPSAAECPAFKLQKKDGPILGSETIDGVTYQYAEWHFDMYPQKSGNCVVPAFAADYSVGRSGSSFGALAAFMPLAEKKRVYSNAVTIAVERVPDSVGPVDAIGRYANFSMKLDHTVAKVGDGLSLVIEVSGQGNTEQITFPKLRNMPEGIKWYESKQSCGIEDQAKNERKVFEYILQPTREGTFSIPAQQFTYYDVHEQRVKTLKTPALSLAVLSHPQGSVAAADQLEKSVDVPEKQDIVSDDIKPISKKYDEGQPYPELPFSFFVALVFLLVLFIVGRCVYECWRWCSRARTFDSKKLYSITRVALEKARSKHDYQLIYQTYLLFFSQKLQVPITMVTGEVIDTYLQHNGMSDQLLSQWHIFFEQAAACLYYDSAQAQERYADLGNKALYWLSVLENMQ